MGLLYTQFYLILIFFIVMIFIAIIDFFITPSLSKSLCENHKSTLGTINTKYQKYFTFLKILYFLYVPILYIFSMSLALLLVSGLFFILLTTAYGIFSLQKFTSIEQAGLPKMYLTNYKYIFTLRNVPFGLCIVAIYITLCLTTQNY